MVGIRLDGEEILPTQTLPQGKMLGRGGRGEGPAGQRLEHALFWTATPSSESRINISIPDTAMPRSHLSESFPGAIPRRGQRAVIGRHSRAGGGSVCGKGEEERINELKVSILNK